MQYLMGHAYQVWSKLIKAFQDMDIMIFLYTKLSCKIDNRIPQSDFHPLFSIFHRQVRISSNNNQYLYTNMSTFIWYTVEPHFLSGHQHSQVDVRITEYPDKWDTFYIHNHNWFPNMCPNKWDPDKWGSTVYLYS